MRKKLRNSMQRIIVNCQLSILVVMLLACSSRDSAHQGETYTCPMHPTVVSDKPGTCPVCGMDLVQKAREGEEVVISKELNRLTKSPNEVVAASINTIRGEYKSIPVTKELLGIVTYDTRSIYVIPARIGGRLEKVYLKYNFQPVTKGMKIAEVYSPELISAQREFVYLIQNDKENRLLIDGAISRLKFLGATEKQVAELVETQKVNATFSIYSPYDGYVTVDEQSPALQSSTVPASVSSSGSMGMSSAKVSGNQPSVNVGSASLPREGSYVDTGQALFKIVSANATWTEFELPTADAESIKKGDEIVLAVENESMKAKVDFIEPFTEQSKDFVRIRSYSKNSKLLIGQLVKGAVSLAGKSSLWLPKSAVLDLGMERVIFIKEQDQFRPKKVEVGFQADGSIEIISGLTSGDEVAIDAHYLMDSEGFIKIIK